MLTKLAQTLAQIATRAAMYMLGVIMALNTYERIQGCLLGGLYADVIGSKYEWISHRELARMFYNHLEVFTFTELETDVLYTDDTQMTICVCEALIEQQDIHSEHLAQIFFDTYEPWRGYGRGTRAVMNALGAGKCIKEASLEAFSEGSFGNGSAMRVAPIGVFFHNNQSARSAAAEASSIITHCHPLGIEAAIIMAEAAAYMFRCECFDVDMYWQEIINACRSNEFREKINTAQQARSLDDLIELGSEINALESVPTALACAAIYNQDLIQCIGNAIRIGGDTDTVAAMAASLVGCLRGASSIPEEFLKACDRDNKKGAQYIDNLAQQLAALM